MASGLEFDAESGPHTHLGRFYIDAPAMVFLNNTLGQRQPESPSSLLGGESWLEDSLEVLIGNALSCILDIDNPLPTAAKDGDGNATSLVNDIVKYNLAMDAAGTSDVKIDVKALDKYIEIVEKICYT